MRLVSIATLAAALSAAAVGVANAQPPAPATAAAPAASASDHYTTASTDIGSLLDDPAASAVVDKYIPGFSTNPQTNLVRTQSLKQIQAYSPSTITDAVLVKIDADFAKLPMKP